LPKEPGVYWYSDDSGAVLYVGKAKNLKNRLLSYRRLNQLLPRTKKLVELANKTDYIITLSEFEALILEAQLVKTYQPKYNILLKDDKSPLYIAITKEAFPRVIVLRKHKAIDSSTIKSFYGPFDSSFQARSILRLLRKAFPFCAAKRTTKNNRACFYYYLHLCPGVCAGKANKDDYARNIHAIELLLSGKRKTVEVQLKKDIAQASDQQAFEKAHELKRQLETLQKTVQAYRLRNSESVLPQLQDDVAQEGLIRLRRILTMALSLPADYPLSRIETYDISNIQGKAATASMVVFTNGVKDLSSYRKFRIKTLNTPNDVGMMAEALTRRLKHPEWGMPQLILIDGGKTQLKKALSVVPASIPVVSIVKHPDRLVMPVLPTAQQKTQPFMFVPLDERDPATLVVQQMRDEAHRFAKTYHQKIHGKQITLDA
jgi:excinuclease ABC subunit C